MPSQQMPSQIQNSLQVRGVSVGIDANYKMQIAKCNKGGYIVIIGDGKDCGAFSNIEDALAFISNDTRGFMQDPGGRPNTPSYYNQNGKAADPVSYVDRVERELDSLSRVPKFMSQPAGVLYERARKAVGMLTVGLVVFLYHYGPRVTM